MVNLLEALAIPNYVLSFPPVQLIANFQDSFKARLLQIRFVNYLLPNFSLIYLSVCSFFPLYYLPHTLLILIYYPRKLNQFL